MYTYTKEEFIMVCYTCDDATDDCILDFGHDWKFLSKEEYSRYLLDKRDKKIDNIIYNS